MSQRVYSGCQGVEVIYEHERIFYFWNISFFFFVKIWTSKYASKVWLVYVVTILHILFVAVFSMCVCACTCVHVYVIIHLPPH